MDFLQALPKVKTKISAQNVVFKALFLFLWQVTWSILRGQRAMVDISWQSVVFALFEIRAIHLPHNLSFNRNETIVQFKIVTGHWLLLSMGPNSWVSGVEVCWRPSTLVFGCVGIQVLLG